MKLELQNLRKGLSSLRNLRGVNGNGASTNGDSASNDSPPLVEEQPLRAELFSIDQLDQHAKLLAEQHELDPRRGPDRLLPRLDENEAVLLRATLNATRLADFTLAPDMEVAGS